MAGYLSMGGTLDGDELLSSTAWQVAFILGSNLEVFKIVPPSQALHDGVTSAEKFGPYPAATHFSQGGVNQYRLIFFPFFDTKIFTREGDLLCKGRAGFFGWMGLGGSCFQWNPDLKIGFAFVPTELEMDLTNMRGGLLQEAVVRVVVQQDKDCTSSPTWWPLE